MVPYRAVVPAVSPTAYVGRHVVVPPRSGVCASVASVSSSREAAKVPAVPVEPLSSSNILASANVAAAWRSVVLPYRAVASTWRPAKGGGAWCAFLERPRWVGLGRRFCCPSSGVVSDSPRPRPCRAQLRASRPSARLAAPRWLVPSEGAPHVGLRSRVRLRTPVDEVAAFAGFSRPRRAASGGACAPREVFEPLTARGRVAACLLAPRGAMSSFLGHASQPAQLRTACLTPPASPASLTGAGIAASGRS
jgi:hypothetical protein